MTLQNSVTFADPEKPDAIGIGKLTACQDLIVVNYSDLPVFNVQLFSFARPLFDAPQGVASRLLPDGEDRIKLRLETEFDRLAAVRFEDAAGVSWIRLQGGQIYEAFPYRGDYKLQMGLRRQFFLRYPGKFLTTLPWGFIHQTRD